MASWRALLGILSPVSLLKPALTLPSSYILSAKSPTPFGEVRTDICVGNQLATVNALDGFGRNFQTKIFEKQMCRQGGLYAILYVVKKVWLSNSFKDMQRPQSS